MTQFEAFKNWIRLVLNVQQEAWYARYLKYSRELTVALLVAVLLVGGLFGYRWYRTSQEQAAQLVFAEGMELYQQAVGGSASWAQVELFFGLGYERHTHTKLAPYLLAFKADAMAKQKKNPEAIATLEQALASMDNCTQLKTSYQTKLALMQMDSTDASVQEKGLHGLEALAHDARNKQNDVAQYYLGLYHWTKNDIAQARAIWEPLIQAQAAEPHATSPWASMADEKLSHLPAVPATSQAAQPAQG